jgi:spermidine synthase
MILALVVLGFTSIVAQTLAIREFMIAFYGNELTIGIIMANWILLGAMGSFIAGRFAERTEKAASAYVLLQTGLTLYLPISIFLIRTIKNILGLVAGEGAGPIPILLSSLVILAPIGLMVGALFPFGAAMLSRTGESAIRSPGRAYVLEGIGFMIGGPVFTYLLITRLDSFGIFFFTGAINMVSAVLLLKEKHSKPTGRLMSVAVMMILALIAASFLFVSRPLNVLSIDKQWKGQHVLKYVNSIYGNLAVSGSGDQYTFYSNGIPIIAAPAPDIVSVEERVHFTMLGAAKTKKVLLIGGGVGGIIREVLKYPVEKVTYVELDPSLIRLVKEFPTPLTEKELSDPRVEIHNIDGRRFLRTSKDKYDVIMLNLPMPSTLQLNRFYTHEFFLDVKEHIEETGIFSFSLPGSLSYISPEQARLNGSIMATLDGVLYSAVIPGDNNLYLGSRTEFAINPEKYLSRLNGYNISTSLINEQYLAHRLDPKVRDWFLGELSRYPGIRKNTDLLPSGSFYGTWYWTELFSKKMGRLFAIVDRLNIFSLLVVIGLVAAVFIGLGLTHPRSHKICSLFVLGTTGFTGMSLSLIIMYAYQSLYGFIFQQIAMLVMAFMAGLTLGSYLMNRRLEAIKDTCGAFFLIEIVCLGSCIAFIPILLFLNADPKTGLAWIFFLASAVAGSFVGFEFPIANKVCAEGGRAMSSSGIVYAVDLAGSWLAALFVSVALVPVIGMVMTSVLLVAIKVASITLVLAGSRD